MAENVPVTETGHTRKASYDLASNAPTTPPDLSREYVWNAQGQLISIRQENRELARYRYNHHGLRVGKQTGSDSTHTLYNEQRQRIADLDNNGHITRQYLTLPTGLPKAMAWLMNILGVILTICMVRRASANALSGDSMKSRCLLVAMCRPIGIVANTQVGLHAQQGYG